MYQVEMYARVRRACMVEGTGIREAAREFGLHRDTVRRMLQYSIPPGYRRSKPVRQPKLEPYMGVIDRILEEDKIAPKKQRHTAKRIYDRLRAEYGFPGGYTIVKDYVRERRRRMREMYVPLTHPPGHAQCDFGQAKAMIGGVERKIHYFVLDLPHSDGCYVKAYPAETTEAFCDSHLSAFSSLGAVYRGASCTTTPAWRWLRSWETAVGSVLGCVVPGDRPAQGGAGFLGGEVRSISPGRRREMVDRKHPNLPIVRQCALLGVSRSSLYYRPKATSEKDLSLMREMDRQYLETPFYGSRRMEAGDSGEP